MNNSDLAVLLTDLYYIEKYLLIDDFEVIFKNKSELLWNKYNTLCNKSLLTFIVSINVIHKASMLDYINYVIKLSPHYSIKEIMDDIRVVKQLPYSDYNNS